MSLFPQLSVYVIIMISISLLLVFIVCIIHLSNLILITSDFILIFSILYNLLFSQPVLIHLYNSIIRRFINLVKTYMDTFI